MICQLIILNGSLLVGYRLCAQLFDRVPQRPGEDIINSGAGFIMPWLVFYSRCEEERNTASEAEEQRSPFLETYESLLPQYR